MPVNKPTRRLAIAAAALTRREGTEAPGGRAAGTQAAERVPLLIIVANTDATFCKLVKAAFAGAQSVGVIFDRRRGDRRNAASTVAANRRYGERRDRLLIGENLRSQGWALVHRPSR